MAEHGVGLGRLGDRLGVGAPVLPVVLERLLLIERPLEREVDVFAGPGAGPFGVVEDQGVDDVERPVQRERLECYAAERAAARDVLFAAEPVEREPDCGLVGRADQTSFTVR